MDKKIDNKTLIIALLIGIIIGTYIFSIKRKIPTFFLLDIIESTDLL